MLDRADAGMGRDRGSDNGQTRQWSARVCVLRRCTGYEIDKDERRAGGRRSASRGAVRRRGHSLAAGDLEVAAGAHDEALQVLEETEDELSGIIARVELGARDDVAGEPSHVPADLHLATPPAAERRRRRQRCLLERTDRLLCALHHVTHASLQYDAR